MNQPSSQPVTPVNHGSPATWMQSQNRLSAHQLEAARKVLQHVHQTRVQPRPAATGGEAQAQA